ncbi:MAG TPA: helix-turn-helix transcriptional regulator [Pirellulales bacterium]|jgi:DNA-binding XRE family transcriptional regulator
MLKEIAGVTFEEMAYRSALSLIRTRIKSLPGEDQTDLLLVLSEFFATDDEEGRESAAEAVMELLAQPSGSVQKMGTETGKPENWVAFISGRIRELRKEAGQTQEQLAEKSGLTQSHICRLERGDHSPSGMTLEKIAKGLGVDPARFQADAVED